MDAWHPAVNPSSRMPVHHARYFELFGNYTGVLNEFPRKYGSSIIREMMFGRNGVLNVKDLNPGLKWMPWWICSDSEKAHDIMSRIFGTAEANVCDRSLSEAYRYYLKTYEQVACREKTMGEAAYEVTNKMFSEIVPVFRPKLVSFCKSDVCMSMYDTLAGIGDDLYRILDGVMEINGTKINNMLAVYMDVEGEDWHVSYEAKSSRFTIYSLGSPKRKRDSSVREMIELCSGKKVLFGSLFSLILEECIADSGRAVMHFGNTYGRVEQICSVLGTDRKLSYLKDDTDSWNYAYFEDTEGYRYPIHLLESYAYRDAVGGRLQALIQSSIQHEKPEIIRIRQGDDFVASICH